MKDQRKTVVVPFGNNAAELEQAALEEGRVIFGPDVDLEVERTYEIIRKTPTTSIKYPEGTRLTASILVRVAAESKPVSCNDCKCRPIQVNITHNHKS